MRKLHLALMLALMLLTNAAFAVDVTALAWSTGGKTKTADLGAELTVVITDNSSDDVTLYLIGQAKEDSWGTWLSQSVSVTGSNASTSATFTIPSTVALGNSRFFVTTVLNGGFADRFNEDNGLLVYATIEDPNAVPAQKQLNSVTISETNFTVGDEVAMEINYSADEEVKFNVFLEYDDNLLNLWEENVMLPASVSASTATFSMTLPDALPTLSNVKVIAWLGTEEDYVNKQEYDQINITNNIPEKTPGTAAQDAPNILFILADDLGYSDVGFNRLSSSVIDDIVTPNIDALANEGTMFTSAYAVHMFCGPSRAGIMTGRYPHAIGSQFNLCQYYPEGIDLNETFFSEVLQDAGYLTGVMGKWHLGETYPYQPNQRGFDEFYGFLGGGHRYFSDNFISVSAFNPDPSKGIAADYVDPLRYNSDWAPTLASGEYLTDVLTTEGMKVVDKAKTEGKPFFLFMSYNAPHTYWESKASDITELETTYGKTYANDNRANYAGMILGLDKQVKVLIDKLKANGQYNNTLIVFMSDNGGKGPDSEVAGYTESSPLKGKKGDVYEGGLRSPMFMVWPDGLTSAPAKFDHVVSGLDLYPTFVNIAGATIPSGKILDGVDLIDHVKNNTDPRADQSLFAARVASPDHNMFVRKGQWKAIKVSNGSWELYDVSIDGDVAEASPVNNSTILDELILDAAAWSKTHIDPVIWDHVSYGFEDKWNSGNMPTWSTRTFAGIDYASVDPMEQNVGISELWIDETSVLEGFPNPASTVLELHGTTNFTPTVDVVFYNTSGLLVQVFTGLVPHDIASVSMSVEDLPAGQYIVALKSGRAVYSTSILIK